MKTSSSRASGSPSERIDARIEELGDWRGATLARIRALVRQADPDVTEEWKWRGVPVWSHDGILCTGETYKAVVKMTFAKGASLADPAGLFNSSLEGSTRRAIDFREGDRIDEKALKELIRAAVALNSGGSRGSTRPRDQRASKLKKAGVTRTGARKAAVPATVDEYIAGFDPSVQAILRKVRAAVRRGAPDATEVISYSMPALRGRGILVYFAAFQGHIGFYPPIEGDARLRKAASRYANEKGNLRFPFSEPIPYDLIERLTALRAKQDAEKSASRRRKG